MQKAMIDGIEKRNSRRVRVNEAARQDCAEAEARWTVDRK